jgi:D-3-phosphoglycerate dehydrogenase
MPLEVLLSDNKATDADAVAAAFDRADVTVEATTAYDPDALRAAAAGVDALIVDASTPVTREILRDLDALRVVGRAGIGFDNIDVRAADEEDVVVVNVPDYCIEEVSTHAFALLLACLRRLGTYDRSIRRGEWDWAVGRPIERLAGSTVGLFAFGKIARRFAAKLRGFDVDVVAHDPHVSDYRMADLGVERVDFEGLLSRSDVLSVHAPLTDETRGTFDASAYEQSPDAAIFVNTARGPIVDADALLAALDAGTVDSAGLDVRETEPPGDSPLHDREGVVLSPHVAWYSEQSQVDLGATVARDVDRVLDGEPPRNRVDPEWDWLS